MKKYYILQYNTLFQPKVLVDFDRNPIIFDSREEAEVLSDGLVLCAGRFVRIVETPGPAPRVRDLTISGLSHACINPCCARDGADLDGQMAPQKEEAWRCAE